MNPITRIKSRGYENVFQISIENWHKMYRRGREADPIRSGERGGSFPSGGNTVKVTRKCVKSLSAEGSTF